MNRARQLHGLLDLHVPFKFCVKPCNPAYNHEFELYV